MKIQNVLNESYRIYHDTYTDAIQHAIRETRDRGYEVDDDEYHSKIAFGPRKPDPGKTNMFSIKLSKDGKPVKEYLHIQVYHMDGGSDKYELNMYIW